MPVHNS